jgi:hypothetical protein
VHEHILAATFGRDETESFCGVEKFDLTGRRHYGFLLNTGFYAANTMSVTSSKSRLISGKVVFVTPGRLHVAGTNDLRPAGASAGAHELFSGSRGLNRCAYRV